MSKLLNLLTKSKKPLIIAGGGIRAANAVKEFRDMILELQIPVVAPLMAIDLLDYDNQSYMGHGGTKGQRSANMAIQRADLIISIGSRLAVSFVGYNPKQFAPKAKKIVVDIDKNEHKKRTIKIDLFLKEDAKEFIRKLRKHKIEPNYNWLRECKEIKDKFFDFLPSPMYEAVKEISELSGDNDVFITDAGITAYVTAQTVRIRNGQRTIIPAATLTMGYALPAIVGVWAAKPKGSIIAITGDGSFQSNIHELQTISYHKIPAKIFVINNEGYLAIRTTEKNNFGRFIGESEDSGISFPDTRKLALAYNIQYTTSIERAMKSNEPIICEVFTPRWQNHLTVQFGKPNDDMFPPVE